MLCQAFPSFAQKRTITGRVTDSSGQAISGASVMIRGANRGVQVNADGHFSLTVRNNDQHLIVSSVGFRERTISVTATLYYEIVLDRAVEEMEPVVLTSYGTIHRKRFTGSASVITNDRIRNLQATTVLALIQGNAPGVYSSAVTGQPGEDPVVRIRGIGSELAGNDPLVIIDGAPFDGSINMINPTDIENITILRDAVTTAMYGARGANGIIQLTTKSGIGKPRMNISALTGITTQAVPQYPTIRDAKTLMELTWEALRNDAKYFNPSRITGGGYSSAEEYATKELVNQLVYNPYGPAYPNPVGLDGKLVEGAVPLWEDDWHGAVVRRGRRSELNLNISGSDREKITSYFISGGYVQDEGILRESAFKRYSGRINLETTPAAWFRTGLNLTAAYSHQNYPLQYGRDAEQAASPGMGAARRMSAIFPIYLRDPDTGEFLREANGHLIHDFGNNNPFLLRDRPAFVGQNPVLGLGKNPNIYERLLGTGNVFGELSLNATLRFRSQYSLSYNHQTNNRFNSPFFGDGAGYGGGSSREIILRSSQTFTNLFLFDKTVGSIHHFNLTAGMEAYRYKMEYTLAGRKGFIFDSPIQPSYGTLSSAEGVANEGRIESFLSNLRYDWGEKYHFSASLRRDGSSRFAPGSRWGTFWSAGFAWSIDREDFLNKPNFLNSFKFKFSYGSTGNENLPGSFPYAGAYTTNSNTIIGGISGIYTSAAANPDLTWEKNRHFETGVEFDLFTGSRFSGALVYFNRTTEDLLGYQPLPPSIGYSHIAANVGSVRNQGFELELSSVNIRTQRLEWKTGVNLTRLRNAILELPPGTSSVRKPGDSWFDVYTIEFAGIDQSTGLETFYRNNTDGNGTVLGREVTTDRGAATRYNLGSMIPKYTGGFFSTLQYKNFDLSLLLSFFLGGKYYATTYYDLMNFGITGRTVSTDILNRWQSPDRPGDGNTPLLAESSTTELSSRFVIDGSYMRVRNITLGFTVPGHWVSQTPFRSVRACISFQNPLTWFSGPKGADPETGPGGNNAATNTTANKTLALGIHFSF